MDVELKDVLAAIRPAEGVTDDQAPHGAFDVILSAPNKDRDGEEVKANEWQMPLPEHITFDVDHGMSVASTVGSGRPDIQPDGTLRVRGTYASTPLAQETRSLVNEGHIRTVSVAFMRRSKTDQKDGTRRVERELLNGAFVAVPANPAAVVLASKSLSPAGSILDNITGVLGSKVGARNSSADSKAIQAIHDASSTLGASCPDPSMGDGPTAGTGVKSAAVSDKPWSDFSAADYTPQQWKRACLIDTGTGDPDSKDRYKLPIREPDGTVNRNAVHAAASVLAGGRGGVQASSADKAKAARALISAYRQLGETPPDSLTSAAGKSFKGADPGTDPGTDPGMLAQAVDAALDEALPMFAAVDFNTLPEPVQQAIGLVQAAWESVGSLLDVMGVLDPDDPNSDTDDDTAVSVLHLRALNARTS